MDASDLRALVVSEQAGSADVELPLRVDVEDGREFVRDAKGEAQGAVERTFARLSWDRRPRGEALNPSARPVVVRSR